jgi:hypothetical protein
MCFYHVHMCHRGENNMCFYYVHMCHRGENNMCFYYVRPLNDPTGEVTEFQSYECRNRAGTDDPT